MKSFSERNPFAIGALGIAVTAVLAAAALNYERLPLVTGTHSHVAYFADAGGLYSGASVRVSGMPVGKVSGIALDGPQVRVTFTISNDVHLGERTEAAIKTKSLLGTKVLDIAPRGDGQLSDAIPLQRTTSPYQLPDALGDLASTIGGLDTDQLSESLATMADTFAETPPDLQNAVHGVTRLADSLNRRDDRLRNLLANANTATTVLAKRSDQIASLVADTDALLTELRTQSDSLDQLSTNITALSQQLHGFIADNREQMRPMLDKLNGALKIVDSRKGRLQQAVKLVNSYAMSLGESVSSGPFFKAYVANLIPGQFAQPFVDAAFSDLGLDPATLLPSERTDPQTGRPGTPALPVPYPRTGQGGDPHLSLPDAITGKPGDPRYPYREPLPAPPPGGPPPGPPAPAPPELASTPHPAPSPVFVPAPDEVAPPQGARQ